MAIGKTGLLVGLGVGFLALLGLSKSSAAQPTSQPSMSDTLAHLSSDPATALSQVTAAMGAPIKFLEGVTPTASGRKYDMAVWVHGNQQVRMIHCVAPLTFYVAMLTQSNDLNVMSTHTTLVDVHPDETAMGDIQSLIAMSL